MLISALVGLTLIAWCPLASLNAYLFVPSRYTSIVWLSTKTGRQVVVQVVRLNTDIIFVTAPRIKDALVDQLLEKDCSFNALLLDLSDVRFLDLSGMMVLKEIEEATRSKNLKFVLAEVRDNVDTRSCPLIAARYINDCINPAGWNVRFDKQPQADPPCAQVVAIRDINLNASAPRALGLFGDGLAAEILVCKLGRTGLCG